MPNKALLD